MREEYGNDLPLYFSSARRIRNIQRLVSADERLFLASLTTFYFIQSDATADHSYGPNDKLATHSLGGPVNTCNSKREQLQQDVWRGEDGHVCLNFVVDLAGLKWPMPPADQIECTKVSYLSPEESSTVSLSQHLCYR